MEAMLLAFTLNVIMRAYVNFAAQHVYMSVRVPASYCLRLLTNNALCSLYGQVLIQVFVAGNWGAKARHLHH